MKNKFFISLCINILVGILFSFPVFSAQSAIQNNTLSKSASGLPENEFGFKNNSDHYNNSTKIYPDKKQFKAPNKSLKKGFTPGEKDNSYLYSIPHGFKKNLIDCFSSDCNYLNPTFVNLTYLKDLRTTKMLC